ncbi:glycosyltransferase [Neobacillus sp. MM2021_6]|uniref:glycosyltransferase n=1 Tax=Bacillaceae TaxID=186817 RepID=UPI0014077893|nr:MULTISPECIES: glycosyltransferase [Bacillaceae]MBO0959951.1 glycosyltransferase [Neobacillus sp. MM2021_6]NHC18901.1 glycosyltransferase [Bacillus sp. MM2020_4]
MCFSVLISVYQKENPLYLDIALNSILDQTLVPIEVVLVKDGPLTQLLNEVIDKYIEMYPGLFKIVSLDKNVGLGNALSIGLTHCSNEIIARMDTDDISLPYRFERQIEAMKKDSTISVLGSWIAEFDNDPDEISSIRAVPIDYEEIKKKAKYRNPLNHMSVVFRKSAVISVGNYQPFLWNEDYFLWVRLLVNDFKITNIEDVLLKVRTGESMYSRRGGFKYLLSEIKLQKVFLDLKFTNVFDFGRNLFIRSGVRFLPNKLRAIVYKKILRDSPAK